MAEVGVDVLRLGSIQTEHREQDAHVPSGALTLPHSVAHVQPQGEQYGRPCPPALLWGYVPNPRHIETARFITVTNCYTRSSVR